MEETDNKNKMLEPWSQWVNKGKKDLMDDIQLDTKKGNPKETAGSMIEDGMRFDVKKGEPNDPPESDLKYGGMRMDAKIGKPKETAKSMIEDGMRMDAKIGKPKETPKSMIEDGMRLDAKIFKPKETPKSMIEDGMRLDAKKSKPKEKPVNVQVNIDNKSNLYKDMPSIITDIFDVKGDTENKSTNFKLPSVISTSIGAGDKTLEKMELKTLAKIITDVADFGIIHNDLYNYNGKRFKPIDSTGLLTLFMQEVDISLFDAKTLRPIGELYRYLSANPKFIKEDKELEKYKYYAVLDNVVIDVENWKFYNHSPSRIILSSVNAKYKKNPHAPVFSDFLSQVTNKDPILIKRMWEFIGYLLIQALDAKVMFVMGTASNSGKSMLCRFLASLFDESQVSNLSIFNFKDMFSTGQLVDKALNISPDLPKEALSDKAISIMKALTGDDKIMARQMYRDPKSYRNRAKFVFSTNHPIKLSTDDKAFWERIIILPFLSSVPKSKQNHMLYKLFEQEKDDIVTIALHFCHELIKNNFIFSTNTTVKCMEQQWMGISTGLIDIFLSNTCTITEDENDRVLVSELYDQYTEFCVKYDVDIVGLKQFSSYLENSVNGVSRKRFRIDSHNPRSCAFGIKIKEGNRIDIPRYYDPNYTIIPVRQ